MLLFLFNLFEVFVIFLFDKISVIKVSADNDNNYMPLSNQPNRLQFVYCHKHHLIRTTPQGPANRRTEHLSLKKFKK